MIQSPVDESSVTTISDDERELMEDAARRLVSSRMSVPALMLLETLLPMNMLAASMLRMISPAWQAILPGARIERLAAVLERRDTIPEFSRIIDAAEEAHRRLVAEEKRKAKEEKRQARARRRSDRASGPGSPPNDTGDSA